MALITVLNGPNLNLLGIREPGLYGKQTLQDIQLSLENTARTLEHQLNFLQSNAEH
jgi:3-dehydroquinate dehydratase-2